MAIIHLIKCFTLTKINFQAQGSKCNIQLVQNFVHSNHNRLIKILILNVCTYYIGTVKLNVLQVIYKKTECTIYARVPCIKSQVYVIKEDLEIRAPA